MPNEIIEILTHLLFSFLYIYIGGIIITFLMFNFNVITLTKYDKKKKQRVEVDDPLIHGFFSFGFPVVWYMCYKNKDGE